MFVATKRLLLVCYNYDDDYYDDEYIVAAICITLLIFCAITQKIERRFLCLLLLFHRYLLCSLLGLGHDREGGRGKRVFLGFRF